MSCCPFKALVWQIVRFWSILLYLLVTDQLLHPCFPFIFPRSSFVVYSTGEYSFRQSFTWFVLLLLLVLVLACCEFVCLLSDPICFLLSSISVLLAYSILELIRMLCYLFVIFNILIMYVILMYLTMTGCISSMIMVLSSKIQH